jgi:elongation factor Ts
MTQVTAQMVKDLREATGAGPLDCKKALETNGGDVKKAIDWLREKGMAKAVKKLSAGRVMNEGLVEAYLHHNRRIGVMVEVNCETDFVANTPRFKAFVKELALHIANLNPQYVRREDVPQTVIDAEADIQLRILKEDKKNAKKSDDILRKIVDGRMDKFYQEIVLMEQASLKDDAKTIEQLLKETVAELGESIVIRRFARFEIGAGADTDENAE